MQARIVRSVIAFVAVALLSAGLNPGIALTDDASRISTLELEIQRLRSRVDEQQRRILRLEEALNRRAESGLPAPRPADRAPQGAVDSSLTIERLPWHAPESWAQVARGMSEAEVKEILGPPTSIESVGSFKTMFYRGPVAGVGTVSGIVNFREGNVVAVTAPDFP